MEYRRLGRFQIKREDLEDFGYEVLSAIFDGVIPLYTEGNFAYGHLSVVGIHPDFAEVPRGYEAPLYYWVVFEDGKQVRRTWGTGEERARNEVVKAP